MRDPYLIIYLKTTRVPSLFFRSVDHTIKNRQQSICQRFPGLITSYSSRKVGGTSQTSNNCFKTVLIKRSKLFLLLCQFFYTCNTFFTPRFFFIFVLFFFLYFYNATAQITCNATIKTNLAIQTFLVKEFEFNIREIKCRRFSFRKQGPKTKKD